MAGMASALELIRHPLPFLKLLEKVLQPSLEKFVQIYHRATTSAQFIFGSQIMISETLKILGECPQTPYLFYATPHR